MDLSNLQSRVSSSYIPPHRTQLHPRMHTPNPNPNPKQPTKHNFLIIIASLFIIPFLFYLFTIARGVHRSPKFSSPNSRLFGVLIDAGPANTRIQVFDLLNEGTVPFVGSKTVRPGLMGFANDPEGAGKVVWELVEFAKKGIPESERGRTKLQLLGSKEMEKMGMDLIEQIFEACRSVLRNSGFLFKDEWAAVMGGQEEGLYAWVAANYALGTLGKEPEETTGIVDLGGASLQVAFVPDDPPPVQFLKVVKLAGVTYNLYTQSMPHFGQDEVWESLLELQNSRDVSTSSSTKEGIVSGPCIPRGYGIASNANDASHQVGNFSACKSDVMTLIKRRRDKCLHPPCEIVSSFLVKSWGKPISPDKFFYVSKFFGLSPKASLSEVESIGKQYCENDWYQLKNQYRDIDDQDLLRHCFSSAYFVVLLHESLGVPMIDKRVGLANKGGNVALDWTLGAFILQTMVEPLEVEMNEVGEIVGNDTVTYLSVSAILLFAVLGAIFVLKLHNKPQLKTIYDLEKGHYIVTRVPR